MKKTKVFTSSNAPQGVHVIDYDGPKAGYREDILQRINERLDRAVSEHSQVLTIPLVVRFPQSIRANRDNRCFQYFIEEYRRKLDKRGFCPAYVWVTEKHLSDSQHYHLILILNGNKIRFFATPPVEANHVWAMALFKYYDFQGDAQGLIHVQDAAYSNMALRHGYLIHRGDIDMLSHVKRHYSYFAKIATKGWTPGRVKEFGASQLPVVIEYKNE